MPRLFPSLPSFNRLANNEAKEDSDNAEDQVASSELRDIQPSLTTTNSAAISALATSAAETSTTTADAVLVSSTTSALPTEQPVPALISSFEDGGDISLTPSFTSPSSSTFSPSPVFNAANEVYSNTPVLIVPSATKFVIEEQPAPSNSGANNGPSSGPTASEHESAGAKSVLGNNHATLASEQNDVNNPVTSAIGSVSMIVRVEQNVRSVVGSEQEAPAASSLSSSPAAVLKSVVQAEVQTVHFTPPPEQQTDFHIAVHATAVQQVSVEPKSRAQNEQQSSDSEHQSEEEGEGAAVAFIPASAAEVISSKTPGNL